MTTKEAYKRRVSTLRMFYRKYKEDRDWYIVDAILDCRFVIAGREINFIDVRYKHD